MSENIKPSEVSEVLLQQLKGIDTHLQFDEVGNVLQVSDGVARIYGLRNAEANELLEFENGIMAIVMNLEEDNVGAVLLGPTDQIKEGMVVKRTKRIASINVGEGMLGRVIDPLGVPLDGRGQIGGELCEMPLERKAPGVIFRQPVNQPLQTGLKSVDAMIPIGRGQRELIIGDRQTGKTSIAIDTILNQKSNYEAGKPVYLPVKISSILRLLSLSLLSCGLTTVSLTNLLIKVKRISAIAAVRSKPLSSSICEMICSIISFSFVSRSKAASTLASPSTNLLAAKRNGIPALCAWSSIKCMMACKHLCTAPPSSFSSQKSCLKGAS